MEELDGLMTDGMVNDMSDIGVVVSVCVSMLVYVDDTRHPLPPAPVTLLQAYSIGKSTTIQMPPTT